MNRLYINKDWSTLKKLLAMNAASGGATPKTETLSGSLVTFSTKKALPLIDCKAEINPVQDLHGYEHPWPAGGGVNILPPLRVSEVTRNGIIFKSDGNGTYSLSGTASSSVSLAITLDEPITYTAGTYYMSVLNNAFGGFVGFYGVQNSTNVWDIVINANNKTQQITFAADTTITALSVYIGNGSTVNFTFSPVLSKTGFVQAFAPYSNICPITEWTGAKVTRTGKNLFDQNRLAQLTGWVVEDGVFKGNSSAWKALGNMLGKSPETKQVTVSFDGYVNYENSRAGYIRFNYTDGTASHVEIIGRAWTHYVLTSDSGKTISSVELRFSNQRETWLKNVQVEYGSTATAYEPYQGNTYDIEFPSEAGTVYGGSLDVTNGVLTVDMAMVDLGTLTWEYYKSYKIFVSSLSGIRGVDPAKIPNAISSAFVAGSWSSAAADETKNGVFCFLPDYNQIRFRDTAYTDASAFKTAMSGVQLVYELATPITYQLTPQEITTLIGTNNVWADTGDITVTYRK